MSTEDDELCVVEVLETTEDEELLIVDVLETTEDEELIVEELVGRMLEELVLLEVDWTTLLLESGDVNSYISSLSPAPQYS